MKNFRLFVSIAIIFSVLFSIFSIHLAADISLTAFLVAAAGTAACAHFAYGVFFRAEAHKIARLDRLFQYLPYILLVSFILRRAGLKGTAYWYDVVTVILWCVVFVSSVVALWFMNEKRVYTYSKSWQEYLKKNPPKKHKGLVVEIFEWVDSFVQAVFMFLLIQIFILQLYVIPSESMVPQFLVGDRVFVFKTASGAKFPLTDVGLPKLRNYKRGDVVVFRNPHYKIDRKSEVQSVTSQIIYMLTLTLVNLNKDEYGQPKADPLVKRICGEAGEQLVMQDGVLYARTKESTEFVAVEKDALFAQWDLADTPRKMWPKIRSFPLSRFAEKNKNVSAASQAESSRETYQLLLAVEEERRNLDFDAAAADCREIAAEVTRLAGNLRQAPAAEIFDEESVSLKVIDLFKNHIDMADKLLSQNGATAWFADFMTSWTEAVAQAKADGEKNANATNSFIGGDIYSEANFRLNLLIKMLFGKFVLYDLQRLATGENLDTENYLAENAQKLYTYVAFLDQRNMPLFPANDADGQPVYLADGNYFMMGDNRFNSLDMRHSYGFSVRNLTALDKYSAAYYSNIEPQAVNEKLILGDAIFCYWPLSRIGKMRTK